MNRRTEFDFSRHEVKVTKLEGVLIHEFKRPNSNNGSLIFINTCGIMTVTGDFGNWVFCREFHPSATNEHGVSAGYWDEKLEIASQQNSKKYDSDETSKLINEFKNSFVESYGRGMNQEEIDWVEELENNVDDEFQYTFVAYRENPSSIDYDSVPFGTKRHFWLDAVYDGFDECCKALNREVVLA